jgi:formamidopyrimidine-DNA glycosylase
LPFSLPTEHHPKNGVLKRKATMPELPEVQHLKEYLDATALHQKIKTVEVHNDTVLRDIDADNFIKKMEGRTFEGTTRRGKYLFVRLDNGRHLQLHFGMTGDLKYYQDEADQAEYERLTFHFRSGYHLGYVSLRMLGRVRYIENLEAYIKEKELGPDFTDIDEDDFVKLAKGRRGSIKSFLMNQKYISGIGNVWSDEVCFHARIHPGAEVGDLGEAKLREIYRTLKDILQQAVAAHAEVDQYPDDWLIKYREEGIDGPKGCGKVSKTEISGRASYFCKEVQGEA